jgi:hypothetical protein
MLANANILLYTHAQQEQGAPAERRDKEVQT